MKVSCPRCNQGYRLDDRLLGEQGRKVRCRRCGFVWVQSSESSGGQPAVASVGATVGQAAAAPAAEAGHETAGVENGQADPLTGMLPGKSPTVGTVRPYSEEPTIRGAQLRYVEQRRWHGGWGWLLLGVVVVATIFALIVGRDQVMSRLPASEPVYQAVGLKDLRAAPGEGLELDVRTLRQGPSLLVQGTVLNTTQREIEIPPMRAKLVDPSNQVVGQWDFRADADRLPPGGRATFYTQTENPPPRGHVDVSFIAPGEG